MELSILRYSSLCRRVVGFVGKRSARTTVGFEGEDPSRVFYSSSRLSILGNSTAKEDETTRPLAPFRGEKVRATLPNSRFSFSSPFFQGHPLSPRSRKGALGDETNTRYTEDEENRRGRIDRVGVASRIDEFLPETKSYVQGHRSVTSRLINQIGVSSMRNKV